MENSKSNNYNTSSQRNDCEKSIPTIFSEFNVTFCSVVKPWIADQILGISEYALLKRLKETNSPWHDLINFADAKSLFPIHFLLFNALYSWQQELQKQGDFQLSVTPLNIRLFRQQTDTNSVGEIDATRFFYLDKTNLFETSESDLENMISSFWKGLIVQPKVLGAFETLEMKPTTDLKKVKLVYKKKMASAHPDKGGCNNRARDLNHAVDVITKALS